MRTGLRLLSKIDKIILVELYLDNVRNGGNAPPNSMRILGMENADLNRRLELLRKKGFVDLLRKDSYSLTRMGRSKIKVVMAGGAFDIIHPGHLETLEKSRALGDALVVSVARDVTFRKNKHRNPLHNEELRSKLVRALKPVDEAILGSKTDIFETVRFLKPDIVALGYDQAHSADQISREAKKRGIAVKVVRLGSSMPLIKSARIIKQRKGSFGES